MQKLTQKTSMKNKIFIHTNNIYLIEAIKSLTQKNGIETCLLSTSKDSSAVKSDIVICDIYNLLVSAAQKTIIVTYHDLPLPFIELIPNVFIIGKKTNLTVLEDMLVNYKHSGSRLTINQHPLDERDIYLLRSFTSDINVNKFSLITGMTVKQVYSQKNRIVKKLCLKRALLSMLAPFIIEMSKRNLFR